MSSDHILFEQRGALGLVTLNRPEKLNALSLEMCERFRAQLAAWAGDGAVAAVAIRAMGGKAFCAGGDIRGLYDARGDLDRQLDFFTAEYALNWAIASFPKPYVALMDGVVMGGGAGVSVHGNYRVGGDKTLFAMPEAAIGLAPDVGATAFLPRLPRQLGLWAGLTGARLGPAEAMAANIIDYWAPSARHDAIIDELAAADFSEPADEVICEVLALNSIVPSRPELKNHLDEIEAAFSQPTLLEVVAALKAGSPWAQEQAAVIEAHCPFSCAVTFEGLRRAEANVAEALKTEFRVTRRCLERGDFYEGVRAAVIDKTRDPAWSPARLEEVTVEEVAAAFAPGARELSL